MIELKKKRKAPDLMRLCYVAARPPALIPKKTKPELKILRFRVPTSRLLFETKFSTLMAYSPCPKREYNTQTRFIIKKQSSF